MKHLAAFIFLILLGCKTDEKIESTYENGNPKSMAYFNSEGELIARQEYYMNNVRQAKYQILNNKPHGEYTSWNYEGKLEESGQMKDGLRSGDWTVWYDRETPQWKGRYSEGKKQGAWKEFWYESPLKTELFFEKGDTVKTEKHYNIAEGLRYLKSCHRGQGLIQDWSENLKLIVEAECLNSKFNGYYKEFDELGELMIHGFYKEGRKDSIWTFYRKNFGLRRLESYENGLRTGRQLEINKNNDTILNTVLVGGTGTLSYKCDLKKEVACPDSNYVNGKLEGRVRQIWKDKYSESEYKDGKKLSSIWYKKTSKGLYRSNLGFYKDEKKTGEWKAWYSNGQLYSIQNYLNGELMGKETLFDSLGMITMEKHHAGKSQPITINLK